MKHANNFKAHSDLVDHLAGIDSQLDLHERLDQLLDEAFAEMLASDRRIDPMFRSHAAAVALSHHAYGCEARLIERATVILCEEQPHIQVVRLDRAIPLVEAARETLRGNDWSTLEGIRLQSRVFAEDSYMPDLVVVDRRNRDLFLFDIKRSVDNKSSRIRALMEKLKAAALVAPDWLALRAKVHAVSCTRIAILDASGDVNEPQAGVMPLARLESLLGIPGLAAALRALRDKFSIRLEQELDRLQATTRSRAGSEPKSGADLGAAGAREQEVAESEVPDQSASGEEQLQTHSGRRVGFATLPPGEDIDLIPPSRAARH